MKIVHSGFDSLYFSIRGALSPASIESFERLKDQAINDGGDVPFNLPNEPNRYVLRPTGKRGGYTYVINTGLVGSTIAFKASLSRDQHNAFVEVSSALLLAIGWKDAVEQALYHVKAFGFHVIEVSINRADYCIDVLDAQVDIDPRDFIAHSRVKKSCYYESASVANHVGMCSSHVEVRTVSQSDRIASITLGKMPGRQVIVYNKRAEVIERRKFYWFDAWGINRWDDTRTVHRVEVRAGKQHLLKKGVRTLDDFEYHIGAVLYDAVRAIRWVELSTKDANVTRAPLHPVWEALRTHMNDALAPYSSPLNEGVITELMRSNKLIEYRQQIIGNLGGYLGCRRVAQCDMAEAVFQLASDVSEALDHDDPHPMMRSYLKAKEKWLDTR